MKKIVIALSCLVAVGASAASRGTYHKVNCEVPGMKSSMYFEIAGLGSKKPVLKSLARVNGVGEPNVYVFDRNGRNVTADDLGRTFTLNVFNYGDYTLDGYRTKTGEDVFGFSIDQDGFTTTSLILNAKSGYSEGRIVAKGEENYRYEVRCQARLVLPMGEQG